MLENVVGYRADVGRESKRGVFADQGRNALAIASYALIFVVFFQPRSYTLPSGVYSVWNAAVLAACGVALLVYFAKYRIRLRWVLLCLALASVFLFSTFLAGTSEMYRSSILGLAKSVGFVTLCEIALQDGDRRAFAGFLLGGSVMCLAHLATVFGYWDVVGGMRHGYIEEYLTTSVTTQNWYLLSYDNESVAFFFPVVASLICYGMAAGRRLPRLAGYAIGAVVTLTYLGKGAATAEAVSVALAAVLLLSAFPKPLALLGKLLTRRTALAAGLAFCVLIVFALTSLSHADFLGTVAELFGKSATFSSRLYIWQRSLDSIGETLFFGVGMQSDLEVYLVLGVNHCHNVVLQVFYQGGLFSAAFYAAALICFVRSGKGSGSRACVVAAAALLLHLVSAGIDWRIVTPIPYMLLYLPLIVDELEGYVTGSRGASRSRPHAGLRAPRSRA